MLVPLRSEGSSHSGSADRPDAGGRCDRRAPSSQHLCVTCEEEPLPENFGNVEEFFRRWTSAPLETEEVRTLARAARASERSFPRKEGRYGSASSWRWESDGREEEEEEDGLRGDGCGDEDEDSERFKESDPSLSRHSSNMLSGSPLPRGTAKVLVKSRAKVTQSYKIREKKKKHKKYLIHV